MTSPAFIGIVIDALQQLNIPYMLVGSFSTNFYGTPRSTKDADFVVQLDASALRSLELSLGSDFEFDRQMTFETVTSTMRYRVRHKATAFMIELFELSSDAHDQSRFGRRVEVPFAGRKAFLPTPEDVIVTKLRWSRHGQRAKDLEAAENVLLAQRGTLDLAYIRSWCDQHGTRDLFEDLLKKLP